MKKLPLALTAIIITHFALKIGRKVKHPEQLTKEETYRAMKDAREQWLREHQPKRPIAEVDARLMRNDPSAALASIGTVSEIEERIHAMRSPKQCDAMALRPKMDMEPAIGSCAR